jgi:hypothetical protein
MISNQSKVPSSITIIQPRWLVYILLFVIVIVGVGVRLINLDNPPLDFHAWRQLRSLSIARGMYYEMLPDADPTLRDTAINLANTFEKLEPNILERIVAVTYLVTGGENPWIARLYSILFWTIGGLALFDLVKKVVSPSGALVTFAFYMLMDFGINASRSFQPDPLMVMCILLTLNALTRFSQQKNWKWAILSGLFGGIAILVKVFAVYPIAISAISLVLTSWEMRKFYRDPKIWTTAAIMILIPAVYYIILSPGAGGNYLSMWGSGFWDLWFSPVFYLRWLSYLNKLFGIYIVFLAFISLFLFSWKPGRILALGLWVSYFLYGMTLPSLIITHSYYNLILIPVIAFCLAPLADVVFNKLGELPRLWRIFALTALIAILLYSGFLQSNFVERQTDYRSEPEKWKMIGESLPANGNFIGITPDYNTRINYYGWKYVSYWVLNADVEMNILSGGNNDWNDPVWQDIFKERTQGMDYFIVSDFEEFDKQPMLKKILYENYLYSTGAGYILFDLNAKR